MLTKTNAHLSSLLLNKLAHGSSYMESFEKEQIGSIYVQSALSIYNITFRNGSEEKVKDETV